MNTNSQRSYFIVAIVLALLLPACGKSSPALTEKIAGDHAHPEAAFERGSHGGRLLKAPDLTIEISIFEDGVPPEFRIYATAGNKPVNPTDLQLTVELTRFAGVVDKLQFTARENYLVSTAEVYEPHSFDVVVTAQYRGKSYRWSYASYEGRTEITAAAAKANGIQTSAAGPGIIEERIALYGAIHPDATRVRHVGARFPGVIRSVESGVGDTVRAGQVLARVESNESLQTYAITAPIAGTVMQRRANVGDTAGAEPLFEIADYSRVWALLNVFPRDRARIQAGQSVVVGAADGAAKSHGSIAAIGPGTNGSSSLVTRVVLDNDNGQWIPGQFINADVRVATAPAPLVVPLSALQTFRDWNVVFLNAGDSYQAQPVTLGKRDADNVEITAGLTAGMNVVTSNSYLVKADIEKSGASHDH